MKRDYKVEWDGGMSFIGSSGTGHNVRLADNRRDGLTPMELLLLGTAGCSCIDFVSILQKARQQVVDAWVEIGGERREEMPRYFTAINMHFVVKGVDVKEQHVTRAIELSMEKYCSASAQMRALAEITTSYEILQADPE